MLETGGFFFQERVALRRTNAAAHLPPSLLPSSQDRHRQRIVFLRGIVVFAAAARARQRMCFQLAFPPNHTEKEKTHNKQPRRTAMHCSGVLAA